MTKLPIRMTKEEAIKTLAEQRAEERRTTTPPPTTPEQDQRAGKLLGEPETEKLGPTVTTIARSAEESTAQKQYREKVKNLSSGNSPEGE